MQIPDFIDPETVKCLTVTRTLSVPTAQVAYVPEHQGNNPFLLWCTGRYQGNVTGDFLYPGNLTPFLYSIYNPFPGSYYRYQPWTNFAGTTVGASTIFSGVGKYDCLPIPIYLWGIGLEMFYYVNSADTAATVWLNLWYGFKKRKRGLW